MTKPSLPEPPDSLTGFPHTSPATTLVRIRRRDLSTWWFSSDGSGRFDLDPPDGTCYLATDRYAAMREASRGGPVSHDWMAAREIRTIPVPRRYRRLAATTRARAASFGVTSELATLLPYDLPRRWAQAFHRHGFDGVRHELRHDPRARPSGVSLFGPHGNPGWRTGTRAPLTRVSLSKAGVTVWDIPPASSVTIVS